MEIFDSSQEEIKKLEMEDLEYVSGGMPESIEGMHYDTKLGMWVEDTVPPFNLQNFGPQLR